MRHCPTGLIPVLVALLVFTPMMFAQTNQQPGITAAAAAPALSHDLSGVWMQYPQPNMPGGLGMDAVNEKFRPPFTSWGQAAFDGTSPLIGPRAVPGKENDPEFPFEFPGRRDCTPGCLLPGRFDPASHMVRS